MEREIAVANGGDAAERIDGQKLWSLKLGLGRFEKLPFIGDTLDLRGEQNPPSKGAPRDPIDFHGGFPSLLVATHITPGGSFRNMIE
jgi:hypothetical protein